MIDTSVTPEPRVVAELVAGAGTADVDTPDSTNRETVFYLRYRYV